MQSKEMIEKIKNEKDFVKQLDDVTNNNEEEIKKLFEKEIKSTENLINLQWRIARNYIWAITSGFATDTPPSTELAFAAFMNNLYHLYNAYILTKKNLFGTSRVLLRHCFEYLMLAKYSSLSSNTDLIKMWDDGDPNLSVRNHVINKIKKPNTSEFLHFWKDLCAFTHASKYSGQPTITFDKEYKNEVLATFVFIRILLECNYHLLNSHIVTPSVKYFGDSYGLGKEEMSILRKIMRGNLKENKKVMSAASKKIIRDYKLKWTIV